MTKIVDARGLACPWPVILTKKAAIGIVSNMYDITETLLGAGKVVTL